MRIPLDRESRLPLYRQIVDFLRYQITSGSLAANTRLPSSRDLAESLGVNRITVNNAYAELEAEGLIFSRLGSGTYVAPFLHAAPSVESSVAKPLWPLWQEGLSSPIALGSSGSDALLPAPGLIDFSTGAGSQELFPIDDLRRAFVTVLSSGKTETAGYGPHAGYLPLRTTITHILAEQGIPTRPEHVLITTGSQQAQWLVMNLLLRPGDTVLVESPTYPGTLELLRALKANVVSIPVDGEGMQVDRLEALLRDTHLALIYTIPTFQNPTGVCMSGFRRRQLLDLARRYAVPILEDEFVGDLRYEGHSQPALKSLDPDGTVIYISTFSKMLMPGLRVGYIVANGPVFDHLVALKRLNDIATSNLIQRALETYITVGRYQSHLHRACRVYRKQRDHMVEAMSAHLPPGCRWYTPEGGLFIWMQLPAGLTSEALFPLALARGVSFAPGGQFFPDGLPSSYLRLNFAAVTSAQIDEGARRLAAAIQDLAIRSACAPIHAHKPARS